jgi:hypothetical protein
MLRTSDDVEEERMKSSSITACALFALAAGAAGAPIVLSAARPIATAAAQDPAVGAEEVRVLKAEFDTADRAVRAKMKDLATPAERAKYYDENGPKVEDYCERFLAIADAYPKSEPAADSLSWILGHTGDETRIRSTFERLAQDHPASPVLLGEISMLEGRPGEWIDPALDKLIASSAPAQVRATALFTAAKRAIHSEYSGSKRTPAEGEKLLEKVIAEHADVDSGKLKKSAENALFALRNLSIGKVAPDIEGVDLDGKPFKLSDYRGKVVVLDFWGNW